MRLVYVLVTVGGAVDEPVVALATDRENHVAQHVHLRQVVIAASCLQCTQPTWLKLAAQVRQLLKRESRQYDTRIQYRSKMLLRGREQLARSSELSDLHRKGAAPIEDQSWIIH